MKRLQEKEKRGKERKPGNFDVGLITKTGGGFMWRKKFTQRQMWIGRYF